MNFDFKPLNGLVSLRQVIKIKNIKKRLGAFELLIIGSVYIVASIWLSSTLHPLVNATFNASLDYSLVMFTILVILVIIFVIFLYKTYRSAIVSVRLKNFAQANGLMYQNEKDSKDYSGIIFNLGSTNTIRDLVICDNGDFEFGNFHYENISSRSREVGDFGYILVRLERNLPHILLDSIDNNKGMSWSANNKIPINFDKKQILKLEGNFNEYFTLYAPKRYEVDVLNILSPDTMMLLMEKVSDFDVEIIDDNLYVYSNKPFDLSSQVTIENIFSIIESVGGKFRRKTKSYSDLRVRASGSNKVTKLGARLDTSLPFAVKFFLFFFVPTMLLIIILTIVLSITG